MLADHIKPRRVKILRIALIRYLATLPIDKQLQDSKQQKRFKIELSSIPCYI